MLSAQFIRLSTDSRALLTNQVRTCFKLLSRECSNVVRLFLHTVRTVSFKLIGSSSDFVVVVMTNFIRMLTRNVFVDVFKSEAVIWWAAIFPLPFIDVRQLLQLSKSESFAMSCSRRHNLREAVGTCRLSPCTFQIRCPGSIAEACIK